MEIKNCLISDVEEILNYINITYKKDIFLRKIFIVIVDRVKDSNINPFNISEVCDSLCVSERTFYRRLKEKNRTYSGVKSEFRRIYSIYLLSSKKYTVKQISQILFFKNSTSFINSFKCWYSCTPKQWSILELKKDYYLSFD